VVINLLANDSDADGDPLSIAALTVPSGGAVTDNNDGTVTYTPAANYNGSDVFSYTLGDGRGGTATGTVSVVVTPVADAPVALDDIVSG